jgi:hypothetical protein
MRSDPTERRCGRERPASVRESDVPSDGLNAAEGFLIGCLLAVAFWALIVLLVVAVLAVASPPASLRIAEDDAGWIPQLMGNGRGHVAVFESPFAALEG